VAHGFYINVASDVVCLVTMLLMRLPRETPRGSAQSPWESLVSGARYSAQHANVRTLLIATGVVAAS